MSINRKRGSIALARGLCYQINGAADDSDDIDGGGYGSVDIAEILSAEVVRLQEALAQPNQSVAGYCKKIEDLLVEIDVLKAALAQPPRPMQECPNYEDCKGACFQCEYFNAETGTVEYPPLSVQPTEKEKISRQMTSEIVAARTLAQQEQEPVAIVTGDAWETDIRFLPEGLALPPDTKLYTHPQRTWVGLTDVEIDYLLVSTAGENEETHIAFARAIEAKLKLGNHVAQKTD